ncbi:MAG: methyl-accepting chemotaxis protein [Tissierellia bacterium]|nr:methyl-accepting chemotaxis protein [Tissierellia bacterium]
MEKEKNKSKLFESGLKKMKPENPKNPKETDSKGEDSKLKKFNFKGFKEKKVKDKKIKDKEINTKGSSFSFNSLKTKLIFAFSIIILLTSVSIGYLSTAKAKETLINQTKDSISQIVRENSKLVEIQLQNQLNTLSLIAQRNQIISMDWDMQHSVVNDAIRTTEFTQIAVIDPSGLATYASGEHGQEGSNEHVKSALAGNPSISDIYFDTKLQIPLIKFAVPIYRDIEVVGVLEGSMFSNVLNNIIEEIKIGELGYSFMIDTEGSMVANPDSAKAVEQYNAIEEAKNDESHASLARALEDIITKKTGLEPYTINGEDMYIGYQPVENTNWILGIVTYEDEILGDINALTMSISILVIVILIAGIIFTYFIGSNIANPIIAIQNISERISDLDITEDVPKMYTERKDETGNLAKSLQNITDNLREIIGMIDKSSEQVVVASKELTSTSQQSAQSSEEVSRTIEEIAKGASEQASSTEQGSTKAALLGTEIDRSKEDMALLNSETDKASLIAADGLKDMNKLSEITEESSHIIEEIHDVIIKTNESSDKINEASAVIGSIARQTNLLALNAAIEAARAGEAGRGFAVVAEEIRKLAEQSSSSTKEIEDIVKELQVNSSNAVKTMDIVNSITGEQVEKVNMSSEKYNSISEALKTVDENLSRTTSTMNDMEEAKNQILDTLQNLTAIAEENAASTQEATASIQEQTASVEEIAATSESLTELAQDLKNAIGKFKV